MNIGFNNRLRKKVKIRTFLQSSQSKMELKIGKNKSEQKNI